jgi:hypothetical protein
MLEILIQVGMFSSAIIMNLFIYFMGGMVIKGWLDNELPVFALCFGLFVLLLGGLISLHLLQAATL